MTINDNLQRTITANSIDTAPLKAVDIDGTASYEVATKGILRIKNFTESQIKKMRKGDGLLIDGQLLIIEDVPKLFNVDNILIRIEPTRTPNAAFATETIKWAKGNNQDEYPLVAWSLNSSDYKVDGVTQNSPLNFTGENPMVLVDATTDVIVSNALV